MPWIGIDLGTTNCAAAVWDSTRGRPKSIRFGLSAQRQLHDKKASRILRSTLQLTRDEGLDVSEIVQQSRVYAVVGQEKGLTSLKRRIDEPLLQASIVRGGVQSTSSNGEETIPLTPTQGLAILLLYIRTACENYLERERTRKHLQIPDGPSYFCTIGVPAHWSQAQRSKVVQAAHLAGWQHVSTLIESTAAAMAYGLLETCQKTILVLDMGGGTTDVTIAEAQRVVVTLGDEALGGDDVDRLLLSSMLSSEMCDDQSLLRQCRTAKERLSGEGAEGSTSETIVVQGTSHTLTRATIEPLLSGLLERIRQLVTRALDLYELKCGNRRMDEVVLVGGSSRLWCVRELLQSLFPSVELCTSVPTMRAVSQGCAIHAALQSGLVPKHELESALMLDSVPHSIGVWMEDDYVELISAQTALPAKGYASFALASVKQAGVSIRVVERVEETDGQVSYPLVGEFSFLLYKPPTLPAQRKIEVGFVLDSDGRFICSIYDDMDPDHQRKRRLAGDRFPGKVADDPIVSNGLSAAEFCLVLLLVILFVLYIVFKIVFGPDLLTAADSKVDL